MQADKRTIPLNDTTMNVPWSFIIAFEKSPPDAKLSKVSNTAWFQVGVNRHRLEGKE